MRTLRRASSVLAWALVAIACVIALRAEAADITVRNAGLREVEEGLALDAEFAFELNSRLEEAVVNGVPLYFVVDFELTRPRWYWIDERTASKRLQLRLSYHALSRQYRLSGGMLQQSFATLADALAVLRRVRGWLVAERLTLVPDARYDAAVRMRLDGTLLPKPLQVSALTSNEWQLESAWRRFSYRSPQQLPAPVETREPRENVSQ